MLDLSWTELLVIAVTAIIFIGPKELPGTLRMIGKWITKARGLAREFQTGVDDMIRHAEFDDIRKQLQKVESLDVGKEIQKAVDPKGTMTELLKEKMPVAVDPETGEPVYYDRALEIQAQQARDDRTRDPDTPDFIVDRKPAPKVAPIPVAAEPAPAPLPAPAPAVTATPSPATPPPTNEGQSAASTTPEEQQKNPPARAAAG